MSATICSTNSEPRQRDMSVLEHTFPKRQQGVATLAIGMLLLLLITLVVLYAARSAILEQRIAANDYRAKMVQAAAAAGLNHGIEHINANARVFNASDSYTFSSGTTIKGWLDPTDNKWNITDTITAADCDGSYTDDLAGYRERIVCESGLFGNVFYYDADGNSGTTPTSVEEDMDVFAGAGMDLNPNRTGTEFRTAYNVDYVLCPLNVDPSVAAPGSKVQNPPCTDQIEDSRWYAIVIASEGFLVDDAGNRIAGGARAESREVVVKFDVLGAGPNVPLMVSGTFGSGGTFDIVANPNGGAAPAWGGKSGAPFSVWSGDTYTLGLNSDTCQLYEFYTTGSPGPHPTDSAFTVCYDCKCPGHDPEMLLSDQGVNGIDILDNDPNFPSDLFQYIFGVPRSERSIIEDIAKANGQYLPDCSSLDENSSGLFWITGDCNPPGDAGRPSSPVLLVVEGEVRVNSASRVFGVVYAFQSPELRMNGGAQVYGAVIGDNVQRASGQGDHNIIYDQEVLDRLLLSPDLIKISRLPGTWSDQGVTQ